MPPWLPFIPQPTRSFASSTMGFRGSMNGSSEKRQPADTEGKAPQRWPLAKRDEPSARRSEEHTSELQSRQYLVCRLLLEKKKTTPQQWPSADASVRTTCTRSARRR